MPEKEKDLLFQLFELISDTYGKDYTFPRYVIKELRDSLTAEKPDNSKRPGPRHLISKLSASLDTKPADMEKKDKSPFQEDALYNQSGMERYFHEIKDCQSCSLGKIRKNLVFGSGNAHADLMLIGEAPGAEEDLQGLPFVGAAGQLLTKILAAIDLKREDVYIANILKCRPPNNRDPLPDEVAKCRPHLNKQIELIKPKVILLLGRVAAQTLFDTKDSLKQMRGRIYKYRDIDVFVTYHPAALLRNTHWKRPAWEDFKKVKKHFETLTSGSVHG